MHFKILFSLVLLCSTSSFSQENIEALSALPIAVSETSGLIFYNGKLITHNDSGNTAQLFEIDTITYQITRSVIIENVVNTDWEDLAQDDEYIYIGDFGNNRGVRSDLRIYRIRKQDYNQSDVISAEFINFNYEDQTDFTDSGNSDWDAEALFVWNDELIVLTKQWKSNGTDAYAIPKTPGQHSARKINSYGIEGLVTGATYNPNTNVLFLVGYSPTLQPFTASFETDASNNSVFANPLSRTNLNIGLAQVEAIANSDDDTYFLSSELFTREVPSIRLESTLYKFEFTQIIEPEPEPEPNMPELDNDEIIVYKGRLYDFLEYQSGFETPPIRRSIFDVLGREVQFVLGSDIEDNRVDLSTLQNGIYYLTFYFSDGKKVVPFYKD